MWRYDTSVYDRQTQKREWGCIEEFEGKFLGIVGVTGTLGQIL